MKLTDAELFSLYTGRTDFRDGLRAVQDAVLAKWEVETREREREAWDGALLFLWGCSLAFKDVCVNSANAQAERDRLYPSLRKPASVTLSTGTWAKRKDGLWDCDKDRDAAYGNVYVATPNDCDKLKAHLLAQEGR